MPSGKKKDSGKKQASIFSYFSSPEQGKMKERPKYVVTTEIVKVRVTEGGKNGNQVYCDSIRQHLNRLRSQLIISACSIL
jgi:hypothetical protein